MNLTKKWLEENHPEELEKYKIQKSMKVNYQPPKSNMQIKCIVKNKYLSLDLAGLLIKFQVPMHKIWKIINAPRTDTESLKFAIKPGKNEYADESRSYVVKNYLPIIDKIQNLKKNSYLDVGSGTGYKTNFIGQKFKSVHGTDIENWSVISQEKHKFEFRSLKNGEIPWPDNTFDFITCFMVLHHSGPDLIAEISKKIRKGGVFMIREHDCLNKNMEMLVELEHTMYEIQRGSDFLEKLQCLSAYEWIAVIESHGFKLQFWNWDLNIMNKIMPTRAFHAVFTKTD